MASTVFCVLVLLLACSAAFAKETRQLNRRSKYDASADTDKDSQRATGTCAKTDADILGPYYKPNAPFRTSPTEVPSICVSSPAFDRVFLNGTVRVARQDGDQCTVKAVRALLDIWQADETGAYSNISPASKDYTCRARVYTATDGSYSLQSIFPGRYDDGGYRPAHIHFTITPVDKFNKPLPDVRPLTTQLYFMRDLYLSPNDSCQRCGSGRPSQIAMVEHVADIKTFVGTWDVTLLQA